MAAAWLFIMSQLNGTQIIGGRQMNVSDEQNVNTLFASEESEMGVSSLINYFFLAAIQMVLVGFVDQSDSCLIEIILTISKP